MTRVTMTAISLSIALIGGALGQTGAPAPSIGTPPAGRSGTTSPPAINAAPLEPGANSFTEAQARARLEEAGLTSVADLKKDEQGIWRGRATRNGTSVSVGVDFRGNVSAQ